MGKALRKANGQFNGSVGEGAKKVPTAAPTTAAVSTSVDGVAPTFSHEQVWDAEPALLAATGVDVGGDFHERAIRHYGDDDAGVFGRYAKYLDVPSGDVVAVLRHHGWSDRRIAAAALERFHHDDSDAGFAGAVYAGFLNAGMRESQARFVLWDSGWTEEQVEGAAKRWGGQRYPEAEARRAWVRGIATLYPQVRVSLLSSAPGAVFLQGIEVRDDRDRRNGVGTAVMTALGEWADEHDLEVGLHPSDELGGDVERLRAWYTRLGYRPSADGVGTMMERMPRPRS
jgi:hypothetical protein